MSPNAAQDRRRADRLLAELLELPAGKRPEHLGRVCPDEPDLRAEVEELLRLAGSPSTPLDRGPLGDGPLLAELARDLALPAPVDSSGSRIGPWRLVRELGRGGMGVVYLAERADGEFEQTAALKLLHPGADSDEVLGRFERERQILASLAHPGIARLLDGGRTGDGRPFFVMERVEGRPIDRYCDEEGLGVEERLALFLQVADAVRHAHRNLVVHRDLKPSNVLVTAEGRAKLLDFGIAKPLPGETRAAEPLTRTVARVLTPEYASPEQVRGEPVTTASDVYQLGLLLYGLLSGRHAHRLTTGSLGEIEDAVCRRVPERPSDAVERGEGTVDGRDDRDDRRTTAAGLRRRLRGDLDAIVMTALRKEPEARYPSVEAFAEDVERHLAGWPIAARGGDRRYRLRKYVQRNWAALAAAAVVLLAVLGYAVMAGVQAREIAHQRDLALREADRANRVLSFLAQVIAVHGDPAALDLAAARLPELEPRPDVQAEMLRVLGEMNMGFGRADRALPLLREAVALESALEGEDGASLLAGRTSLAGALYSTGRLPEAAEEYRHLTDALRDRGGGGRLAAVLRWSGELARLHGDYDRAEASLLEALAIRRRIDEPGVARVRASQDGPERPPAVVFPGTQPHLRLARTLRDLAELRVDQGAFAAAERALDEAMALERLTPGYLPSLAETLAALGRLRRAEGRLEEADRQMREALAAAASFGGREAESVSRIRLDRVRLLLALGRTEEARAQLAAAEAGLAAHVGQDPLLEVHHLHAAALLAAAEGDRAKASDRLGEAARLLAARGLEGAPLWVELRGARERLASGQEPGGPAGPSPSSAPAAPAPSPPAKRSSSSPTTSSPRAATRGAGDPRRHLGITFSCDRWAKGLVR